MFVRIQNLLSAADLRFVDELVAHGNFVDGAVTTGTPTRSVKHNSQLDLATHAKRDDFLRMITRPSIPIPWCGRMDRAEYL